MKRDFDKPTVLAVMVAVGATLLWWSWSKDQFTAPPPAAPGAAVAAQPATTAPLVTAVPTTSGKVEFPRRSQAEIAAAAQRRYAPLSVGNKDTIFRFAVPGGALESVAFPRYLNSNDSSTLTVDNKFPVGGGKEKVFAALSVTSSSPWALTGVEAAQSDPDGAAMLLRRRFVTPDGAEFAITENWRLAGNYRLDGTVTVQNVGKQVLLLPKFTISAGDLQPWHKLSGDPLRKGYDTHTLDYCTLDGKVQSVAADSEKPAKFFAPAGTMVTWAGLSNRYFAVLLKSDVPFALNMDRAADGAEFIAAAAGNFGDLTLAPGAEKSFTLGYYAGPKLADDLRAFTPSAAKVMRLGWFPIDFLAHLMLFLLNWIEGFTGSYGWSIILLTLLVRVVFFPVMMKANASMRDMQLLAPEVKAIRDKYKSEPMVAQGKISELYKSKHVSPLGGCLPMLIQIPVFLALYYALGSAVELRQVSFWWIKDLAQPDTVAKLFGLGVHPLVLIWTGLLLVQQKITPTAMDPLQAKMMLAMPLVMLFILYDLPSGLTLYWAVSQLFSLAQLYYQHHGKKKQGEPAAAVAVAPDGRKTRPRTVRS